MRPTLLTLSTDTTAFPWANRTPLAGLRASVAVAIALSLGHLTGHPAAGAIAAGSAFTVGFAVFHRALASVLLSMALLTLGIASATLAGSVGAAWTPVVLLLTLLAAVNYGLLSTLGPTPSWMGQQCAVFLIVAGFFSNGLHYALGRTAMVLAGGALQMLLFTAFHFLPRPAAQNADQDADETSPRAASLAVRLRRRLAQLWQQLRSETRLRAGHNRDTASYTLRLALTLLLSTAVYRHFQLRNGYWLPMTALLVLKPQWSATLSRSIARLTGTLAGAGIALLLAHLVPLHLAFVLMMVLVFAWACYALQAVNYAAFSLCITLYIVFLFRSGGFSQTSAAHIRLFNTALGGLLALAVDALWTLLPTRIVPASPAPASAPSPPL